MNKVRLWGTFLMFALCAAQHAPGQVSQADDGLPEISIAESVMLDLIAVQQDPPPRPIDPAVVTMIRRSCCERVGFLQLRMADGTVRTGKVIRIGAPDAFIFRLQRSKVTQIIPYDDVLSVKKEPPTLVEVVEITGGVALMVVAFPLVFIMGLQCGFSCS